MFLLSMHLADYRKRPKPNRSQRQGSRPPGIGESIYRSSLFFPTPFLNISVWKRLYMDWNKLVVLAIELWAHFLVTAGSSIQETRDANPTKDVVPKHENKVGCARNHPPPHPHNHPLHLPGFQLLVFSASISTRLNSTILVEEVCFSMYEQPRTLLPLLLLGRYCSIPM